MNQTMPLTARVWAIALFALQGVSALPPAHALTPAQTPLFIGAGTDTRPRVMLNISKDQQLFKKAYNDYSDLDGDGQLETTYKHSIDYYGYFDSYKCYNYSTANGRFEPAYITANKYCNGTTWSGNFLNWVTMSRMDAVRKLLYGGLRSSDTESETVLERAYIPTDAHAWAKYYNGSDINQLTPFNPPTTPPTASANSANESYAYAQTKVGSGDKYFISSSRSMCLGDQVKAYPTGVNGPYMVGYVSEVRVGSTNYSTGNTQNCSTSFKLSVLSSGVYNANNVNYSNWTLENLSGAGISFCNLTLGGNAPNDKSHTNTNPPLMRVAQGNFSLWSANERWQCYWKEESRSVNGEATFGSSRSNGNQYPLTGLAASAFEPVKATHGLGNSGSEKGEYKVRVQACVSGLIGKERCKRYPKGNYKPIGLLQYYGDDGQLHFGLMTGSYAKNISGGVLRKNIGPITDEVNVSTDGSFTQPATPPGSPRSTTSPSTPPGIINTLNYMRIYGYRYDNGTYQDSSGDNCTWQLTNITENQCTSWGNPMSELYFESLRYLAGKSATSAYTYTNSGSKDNLLGLPLATWSDPLTSTNYCAPLNVVMFNASVSSYDSDLATTTLGDINATGKTAADLTDLVGSEEGIHGKRWFIGRSGTNTNELCDAKTVSSLGSVAGICPEGPTVLGAYLMSGLAYHARTQRIRTDLTPPASDTRSLKVSTYGVQLATNVPQIRVAVQGESKPRVIIQPAYRLLVGGNYGGGQLVDMRIVEHSATPTTARGLVYLNWEDSEQGGDYDQDVWGILKYELDLASNTIRVTTKVIAESTSQPQGFGYIISGTTQDGPHFHSGIEKFNYTDPTNISVSPSGYTNASGGCDECNVDDPETTATYTLGTSPAGELNDPLWYAAKWGGFSETGPGNNLPDLASEWDVKRADGSAGSDGVPDNYFLVTNPLGLEQALDRTFTNILEKAAASAVATNSTSIRTDSRVYQGRFNANGWSGQLLAYTLSANGVVGSVEEWDASLKLNSQVAASSDTRTILTLNRDTGDGMAFTWANISGLTDTTQKDALNQAGGLTDGRGADRVGWLRGHSQHEGKSATHLRERPRTKLGDIVNSNPIYVGPPSAGYSDVDHPGYEAFAQKYKNRRPMLYVGANDGMLHGFNVKPGDANVGKEMLAYVPGAVYANLSELTRQGYLHRYYVDGSPMVADAVVGGQWRTVLIGTLGAGGKGVFALDVTNPDDSSLSEPTFSEANAAALVLWEFTSEHDADLGLTINTPAKHFNSGQSKQIVRMNNGKWALIIGNGYASANGRAALFILFLDGGTDGNWTGSGDYVKLVVGSSSYSADGGLASNGLSTPTPLDRDGDGKVDVIYAGDLNGNLWKFDVSASNPASWQVDLAGQPLFTAKNAAGKRQSIVAPPEVTPHPQGGYMVLFGTGRYLDTSDVSNTDTQSLYGVWDRNGYRSGNTTVSGETIPSRAWLRARTATAYPANSTVNGKTVKVPTRLIDTATLSWCLAGNRQDCEANGVPNAHLGWYLDLPESGERVTGVPQLSNGVVYFSTLIPSSAPCEQGGEGWLIGVDYLTGSLPGYVVFDTNNDAIVTSTTDARSAAVKTGAAIGGFTFVLRPTPNDDQGFAILNKVGAEIQPVAVSFGRGRARRVSWQELVDY